MALSLDQIRQQSQPAAPASSNALSLSQIRQQGAQQAAPATPAPGGLGARILGGIQKASSFVNRTVGKPFIDVAAAPVQGLAKLLGKPDPYANGALGGVNVNPVDKPLGKAGSAGEVGSYFFPYGKVATAAKPLLGRLFGKVASG